MQDKILITYNCCGVSGRENFAYYVKATNSFFQQQNFDKFDVVLSGCILSQVAKDYLAKNLDKRISINYIEELHPVNVTLNHTVIETVKRKGEYAGYMYVDSGSNFNSCPNGLSILYELLQTNEYGMVSPQPQNDTEYFRGLGVGNYYGDDETARRILFANGNYIIPPARAFATHTNVVHNDLFKHYGKIYPDIFASHCTESIFFFMNAALKKKWILVKDVMFNHEKSLDGPSSGFNPGLFKAKTGKDSYEHGYFVNSIVERLREGQHLGMGYEWCQRVIEPNWDQFDENYHCRNDELKDFIRDKAFLTKEEFDYDDINHEYIEK